MFGIEEKVFCVCVFFVCFGFIKACLFSTSDRKSGVVAWWLVTYLQQTTRQRFSNQLSVCVVTSITSGALEQGN